MISVAELVKILQAEEKPASKAVLARHGAKEPFFGISLEWLKKYAKTFKRQAKADKESTELQTLGLELWATGISDARYLAGLILEPAQLTPENLESMVRDADWTLHTEYTVPGLAAESGRGWELGLAWIDSAQESIASAGWATLGSVLLLEHVPQPSRAELESLLGRIERQLEASANRVRYCMNNFVINVGAWSADMTASAKASAAKLGTVKVFMGETACKVPDARAYLEKMEAMGKIGVKRKRVLCD